MNGPLHDLAEKLCWKLKKRHGCLIIVLAYLRSSIMEVLNRFRRICSVDGQQGKYWDDSEMAREETARELAKLNTTRRPICLGTR